MRPVLMRLSASGLPEVEDVSRHHREALQLSAAHFHLVVHGISAVYHVQAQQAVTYVAI